MKKMYKIFDFLKVSFFDVTFVLGVVLGLIWSIPFAIKDNYDIYAVIAFVIWSSVSLYRPGLNLGFVITFFLVTLIYGQVIFFEILIFSFIFVLINFWLHNKKILQNA